jgi:hypothetical protein
MRHVYVGIEMLNTYVCDVYLCLCWLFMFVMIYVMYICNIYVISFVCVDGIQKTNKKGAYWSLCRVSRPYHSTKNQDLGTGIGSLPSVMSLTLGKELDMRTLPGGFFAKCPKWHSAKIGSLPSAFVKTLGKGNSFCRVSSVTLGKDAVSITRRRNGRFYLPSAPWHSANLCAECPRKSTRQRRLSDALFAEPSLPSVFKALPSASTTRVHRPSSRQTKRLGPSSS